METTRRREEHVRIIRALADGCDPFTGEAFDRDSPYQHPDVIRALMGLLHSLELAAVTPAKTERRRDLPANTGKPWTEADDQTLAASYDAGTPVPELARTHGRTPTAIRARLHRLGRIQEDAFDVRRFSTETPARRTQEANRSEPGEANVNEPREAAAGETPGE